mmetsp:Transcript_34116/g.101373  ORF Transcript_34116/g.101373 Transcript_34116/m.101373 type:complete len:228 (+) Transcript_34116:1500-2183(+)
MYVMVQHRVKGFPSKVLRSLQKFHLNSPAWHSRSGFFTRGSTSQGPTQQSLPSVSASSMRHSARSSASPVKRSRLLSAVITLQSGSVHAFSNLPTAFPTSGEPSAMAASRSRLGSTALISASLSAVASVQFLPFTAPNASQSSSQYTRLSNFALQQEVYLQVFGSLGDGVHWGSADSTQYLPLESVSAQAEQFRRFHWPGGQETRQRRSGAGVAGTKAGGASQSPLS